jgi:HEAT repeat protein/lysophospholipase L1-like esterase
VALSAAALVVWSAASEGICRLLERREARRPMGRYITEWADWDGDFYTVKSTAVGWPPWEDYNSDGLRDREHAVRKGAGVHRVVCLGDSTTMGWNVRPEEAYPQILQDRLGGLGRSEEVFNVALGGWSTRQERIAYRRLARKYRPDQVLIGICLNDVAEMQNNLSRPPALLAGLHRRSALVRRIVRAGEREVRQMEDVLTRNDSTEVRDGFAKLFAELRTLRDDVRADGANLAVLMFPARFQLGGSAPPTAQSTVAAFCAAEGLPYLDLLPALFRAGGQAFIDEVHLSPLGARVVADEVVRSLLVEDGPERLPANDGAAAGLPPTPARPQVPALMAALRGADPDQRAAAARALGLVGAAAAPAVPGLVAALGDRSPDVRAAAAWALGGTGGGASAVAALTRRARDDNPRVREGASWALGRMAGEARSAVPALVPLLNDADDSVRWRAADALAAIGPSPDALPALLPILSDPQAPGRGAAAEILGRMGAAAEPAVMALVVALEDPREGVRWRAAWGP